SRTVLPMSRARDGAAPLRPMPVSIFRCTRARRSACWAAALARCSISSEPTETSMPEPITSGRTCSAVCGSYSQVRMGTSRPARARARALAGWATPSQVAPPSRAARAAVSIPCPYPSALTTAISAVCSWSSPVSARVFSVIAEGSMRTRFGRCRGSSAGIGRVSGLGRSRRRVRQDSGEGAGQVVGDVQRQQGHQSVTGGAAAGAAVEEGSQGGGIGAGQSGGQQRAEHPGQHVSGAGGGQLGGGVVLGPQGSAVAGGDHGDRALVQDGGTGPGGQGGGELSHRSPGVDVQAAGQPGGLSAVRGEDHVGAEAVVAGQGV